MGKFLTLCGLILCLSLTATAQDSTAALEASSPEAEPAAPVPLSPSDRAAWQLGVGYKYVHFDVLGLSFHNNGFNVDVTRYFNNWLGVEGALVAGFGHTGTTPVNRVAKSLFVGAGPHVAVTNSSRFEPWIHTLFGLQHFRFTQTSSVLGLGSHDAFGWVGGGGVDVKLGWVSWRIQGDYVGTHFNSTMQNNYSFGSGLVFSF